ncbi:MAG: YggN family protein [Pseudomonadota bacterium]|nr:YggN family protein [Pseudomonadota bacterium]
MRVGLMLLLTLTWCASPLQAQDLAATCHATSSYDITLKPAGLAFDRPSPAPFHVELQAGTLRTDGQAVVLNAENQDRLVLFERQLRALVPQVRTVARHGVEMAVQGVRAEADGMGLGADTRAELDRRLNTHADALKRRIAVSQTTHDWQGDFADQTMNQIGADLLPLLASDLGQQAINAALAGDLQAAASLRDRAASLATELQPRMQQRMQALRPQIQALCPAIEKLAALQQGVRGSNGQPLNLLQLRQ